MDTTAMMNGRLIAGSLSIALACVLIVGCSTSPPPSKNAVVTSRTPIPPEAERVEKPVNVSFSTYSKEWPVNWQWIDPAEKDAPTPKNVRKGVLQVRIPTAKDMRPGNMNAPRYIKPISGDFQIETHVRFSPKENYQGAGLLIYVDDNRYIRFEKAYGGVGGGAEGLRIDVREGNEYTPLLTPDDAPTELGEIEMKIVRKGGLFTAYWRENDEASWREAGQIETNYPQTVMAGLIASNTAREIMAEFDFIRLLPENSATK
jgi:regulation of enolase protein 1 (concanavalin A-like superfamily)